MTAGLYEIKIAPGVACGVAAGQQVGYADLQTSAGGFQDAILWNGTAASAVDLRPTGLSPAVDFSVAVSTNGLQQVGYAGVPGGTEAVLWSGTANSAVDLDTFLPGSLGNAEADYIDSAGNIFGTAEGTYGGISGNFSVEWTNAAVPEPAGISLLGLGGIALLRRRIGRRRRRL